MYSVLTVDAFALDPWEVPTFISHTCCHGTLLIVNTHFIHDLLLFQAWNVHKRQELIEPVLVVFKEEKEALELLTLLRL